MARSLGLAEASDGRCSVRGHSPSPPPPFLRLFVSLLTQWGRFADKYVPFGYHNRDVNYDTTTPSLTEQQKEILAYPHEW